MRLIAHALVLVELEIVDAPVVGRERCDQLRLLLPALLLLDELLVQFQFFVEFLLLGPRFRLGGLGPAHLRDIDAHAKRTQPSRGICELELCRLQVSHVSGGVRHVFEEDVRLVHIYGLLVVLDEVVRRFLVEYLMVCQPYDPVRISLVSVLRKGLIAGEVLSGLGVLREAHRRHVRKKRSDRSHQIGKFRR